MSQDRALGVLSHSCERLDHYQGQIMRSAQRLSDDELWFRPNPHVNSVANLVLHLTGNVRQWILGGVAGIPVERDRPAEFSAQGGPTRDELLGAFTAVVCDAISVISELKAAQLAEFRLIQGYEVTVQTAVLHVVEHLAFHAGQIVHTTKWLKDVDLSLYNAQGQRIDGSGQP